MKKSLHAGRAFAVIKENRAGLILRLFGFGLLWWALTEGDTYHLWLGAFAIAAATTTSLLLFPKNAWPWALRGFLRFGPYFLWQSLAGGIDVARRALAPSMPIQPAVIRFHLRLRHPPAAAFLAWTVGLLPGTASIRLRRDVLEIHALDARLPIGRRLREVEERVAALFSQQLSNPGKTNDESPEKLP
jgi:multicomponent Na+:H+ antiporter subunit E